jgi:hypothetical protein
MLVARFLCVGLLLDASRVGPQARLGSGRNRISPFPLRPLRSDLSLAEEPGLWGEGRPDSLRGNFCVSVACMTIIGYGGPLSL